MPQVLDHTSVPDWALEPMIQPVDAHPAHGTILAYDAAPVAGQWSCTLAALGVEHRTMLLTPFSSSATRSRSERDAWLAEERRTLRAEVERAVVGFRLLIAGPLVDVLRARAIALGSGLLDEEIVIGTTSVTVLPVTCAHCGATTVTRAAVAHVVTCMGCDLPLIVHHHVSRLRGTFLGYKSGAEEWSSEKEVYGDHA